MIVEDNAVVAMHLKMLLEQNGYLVIGKCTRGEDAILMAESNSPDLIFMDIMLEGEVNGIDATHKIRKFSNAPIIFMSALTDENSLRQMNQFSNIKLTNKPFKELELLSMTKQILGM
ncbi:putative PAS/PAC sensor protein [Leptospira ellinghausenii]|uniref:Putative PAS/PAC sensor protein n=1 Tax=Leptospira ellinghausenii TaxID=1917822 RepID=A0A2P2DEI6_9LEPT|nr:response regulator [Leptospira ellinghausenii]GBF43043.1 putative PAS/PAC sensor protein [Leptospira ellinghausenii]